MADNNNNIYSGLDLVLVFHLNQNLDPYVKSAARTCYRGLLDVLMKHKEHRFVLHISGTLIHALRWYEPDVIKKIQAGIDDGRFELLGSTYAQNIIYSTDDWSNRNQLEEHQRLLAEVFGYTPQGFWNPERCWRQDMAGLLSAWAYKYTTIEEHALGQAGLEKPHGFWRTAYKDASLNIFNDDESFRHVLNIGIWTGDFSAAIEHITRILSSSDERPILVYAEDAEATGLWGYRYKMDPRFAWSNLDRFLTELKSIPEVNVTCFEDINETRQPEDIGEIADSQAGWMVCSLKTPGAPYHENGFTDWFDFNEKAPKLNHYRPLFVEAGSGIEKLMADTRALRNKSRPNEAAERLLAISRRVLAGHQFEFGCIGIGGIERYPWRPHVIYNVSCSAAQIALDPPDGLRMERADVNGDGIREIIIYDSQRYMVFSEETTSLLYWYDLTSGYELTGNELALGIWGKYTDDQGMEGRPHFGGDPKKAWPDLREQGKPKKFSRDEWWFRKYVNPVYLDKLEPELTMPVLEDEFTYPLSPPLRVRALHDNADNLQWKSDYITDSGILCFTTSIEGLDVRKEIRFTPDQIICEYYFVNKGEDDLSKAWTITNGFTPDYLSVMDKGTDILKNIVEKTEENKSLNINIFNSFRGISVNCVAEPCPDSIKEEIHFFAVPVKMTYHLQLSPNEEKKITLKLSC